MCRGHSPALTTPAACCSCISATGIDRAATRRYLGSQGKPVAFHSEKASVFRSNRLACHPRDRTGFGDRTGVQLWQHPLQRMTGTSAQKPAMHSMCGFGLQQSCRVAQRSSISAHAFGAPQEPFVQDPLQQSVPLEQLRPSSLHGSSAAKARTLPLSSSCPGRKNAG